MRLAVAILLLMVLQDTAAFRVVCVYTNWAQYRQEGGKFLPEDVDPALCTHIIYVYAKLNRNKLTSTEWNDDGNSWSDGMYDRVNKLKQLNPDMKTLLGVGGWNMGSKDFSKMASGRVYRRIFARSAVKFLRDRNFDGLTIDWQHPTKRGGRPKDRINFSLLLQELRQAFDANSRDTGLPALLLTAGVSASQRIIEDAYEVDNITKYTDFINVFAYDLHGSWENFTGHPSQLYARDEETGPLAELNVDASMRYWMAHVTDRNKLNLGISTSGRTFTLADPMLNGVYAESYEPGLAGDFTQTPGMLAYYERCFQYMDATRVWDDASKSAYWYSGDQWIAGEDEESVKHKVFWSRRNKIGGVMLSSLAMDDFKDKCIGGKFALLQTIGQSVEVALPSTVIPTTLEPTTTPEPTTESTPAVKKINPKKAIAKKVVEEINKSPVTTANTDVDIKPAKGPNVRGLAAKPAAKPAAGAQGKPQGKPRKRPVRRRLTPEQRKRLIRRKMKNHKGKIPTGWGKRVNLKKGGNGPAVQPKNGKPGAKLNKPKQEVVALKEQQVVKGAEPANTGTDASNVNNKQQDTTKTQGNKPTGKKPIANNNKNVKANNKKPANGNPKFNKKAKAKMLKRKGLGFKRQFKFGKGPGGKNRRKRPARRNAPKKAAAA